MRNGKTKFRALVLALLSALGMMAFAAAETQAILPAESVPGTYLINLGTFLSVTVGGESGLGSLLVPTRDLKLECHSTHVEEGKIDTSTDALGKVTFLKCVSLSLSSGEPLPCETTTLGTITASFLALPILHGVPEEPFVLFEPQSGTSFTSVLYKEGTECPLPRHNPVTGSISGLVHELDAVTQLISFSPAIQLLSGDILRFGLQPSYIHGLGKAFLVSHQGQKLGIH